MTRGAAHYGPRDEYVIRRKAGNPGVDVLTPEIVNQHLDKTLTAASKAIGVNHKTLRRYAIKFGVEFAKPMVVCPKRPPREELAEKCKHMTKADLQDEYGVADTTVYAWLKDYGLQCQDGRRRTPPRMDEWREIRISALWMRKAMGKPFGGACWHSWGGMYVARGEYA